MDISLEMQPEMRQWISPRLIEANHILSLSLQELEQTVMAELDANPALEMEENQICPLCGNTLEGRFCATCALDHRDSTTSSGLDDDLEAYQSGTATRAEDEFDPMTLVASESSLIERIMMDVGTLLADDELPVAEYILHNLDERGYLEISPQTIADLIDWPVEKVERVLRAVQQVAPVGVAARDMRECLLLQLTYLAQSQEVPETVFKIVGDHLNDLAAHKYGFIARQLGVSSDDVCAARDFIRANLNPFPLQNQEARWWKTPTSSPYTSPDVIITIREDEFHVEIVDGVVNRLRLNPLYQTLAAQVARSNSAADYSTDERTHIRQYVTRAKLFVSNINQRHETLRKITYCLLDLQGDFIRQGVRSLKPLTRAMVADQVGVHESTVSRATANKYLMLPNRQVIPFSAFFTASLSVKDVIKEMVEKEQGALTDQEICQRLRKQGYRIARRTIAKYRAQLGILPSTLR